MAARAAAMSVKSCINMIKESKVLAPNLKECHLWVYKGSIRPNHVMKDVILKHLLALRWMNPGAMVYLRESNEEGQAHVEYELWNGRKSGFIVEEEHTPESVVAKLMFEARDPAQDPDYYKSGWAAEGLKAAGVEAPPSLVASEDNVASERDQGRQ